MGKPGRKRPHCEVPLMLKKLPFNATAEGKQPLFRQAGNMPVSFRKLRTEKIKKGVNQVAVPEDFP